MADYRKRFLVAYDIRDEKRLRQVHKTMKGFGWAMQYSVFICDLDSMEMTSMKMALGGVIHHGADSIAVIDLGPPADRGQRCFQFMGIAPQLPTSGPVII